MAINIKKIKVAIIAGARPNMMKAAPICRELRRQHIPYFFIHTGQHFTPAMAADFFKEFKVKPDYILAPARFSVARQFADVMRGLEKIFLRHRPDLVMVMGDVNSTLAAALTAKALGIPLAHVEAGLRSYNKIMPEERNRALTDALADYLFTTAKEAKINLRKEGLTKNVFFVGNIMIDTLVEFLPRIKKTKEQFYFCTLHRAENTDNKKRLAAILAALAIIAKDCKVYLPLHPRTEKVAKKFGLFTKMKKIFTILPPLNYQQSLYYQKNARLVLTDSGGIQEESSYLGTPCLTLRTETERPITVRRGTNTIGGVTKDSILKAYREKYLSKRKTTIPYWDGKTASRIVQIIKKIFNP